MRFGTYHVFQCPPGQEAGILLWMGPGSVAHDRVVRSMRLFAEQVMPRFH